MAGLTAAVAAQICDNGRRGIRNRTAKADQQYFDYLHFQYKPVLREEIDLCDC